jgi:orotidine-5'-phosphate decarboxylase
VVAVTVLTSMDDADLAEAGYGAGAAALAERRIATAARAGADAIVCSPAEAAFAAGSGLSVITPGVRLPEDAAEDQKRVADPAHAIVAGADAVVVGRPISAADDPRAAAERYRDSIAAGLSRRASAAG